MENKLIEKVTKKGRAYRFNMEITLKPDRQAYLIDVLLMITRRNLPDIAMALQISVDKLMNVHRREDFFTKQEADRALQLWVLLCEG